jgi:adenosylmethionine-8-amino-7-oxononanoate aminotransferase
MATPTFLHPFSVPAKPADEFVSIVRGRGARVWDADGNEYVDAMAALWYANIGYGDRRMADAIAEAASSLGSYQSFTSWTNPYADRLADRVADLTDYHRPRVFFCSSGSEAVESAMKIARATQSLAGHPERTVVISRERGYHGVAYGGTSLSGLPPNQEGFGPFVDNVVNVDADDLDKLEVAMEERRGEIAAVITEPVQGVGGVRPPEPGYLEGLRDLCDRHGALLIFDEVITGFGRLGTWFGSQHFGVTPDLTAFAKAITSGYVPLGGVIVGDSVREVLESDDAFVLRHGFTYSGHALACAAGMENLGIIESDGLLGEVPRIADAFSTGFAPLLSAGLVADVRGVGGMWAIGTTAERPETMIVPGLLERGVIARSLPGTVTFCPPLVITDDELDRVVTAVTDVLGA